MGATASPTHGPAEAEPRALCYPSNLATVLASIPSHLRPVEAPIPARCWHELRSVIAASDPTDSDF